MKNSSIALSTGEILLPADGLNYEKWATIACDQHTADPNYWARVESFVGDAPSSLRMVLPEIYLDQRERRVHEIHGAMRTYLAGSVRVAVPDGFVLVERQTTLGTRLGLLACLDLESYDFSKGSKSLIRATEGTVEDRLPPRAQIRASAPLECPHVMVLIDDPEKTVIEPALADPGRELYNFDLMMGGGRVRGWALENGRALRVFDALSRLSENCGGLLYAVGDGNHSLAAAKLCWEEIKGGLSAAEFDACPARYALVELVNLHCPALRFEPIHRVLLGVDAKDVLAKFRRKRSFRAGGEDLRVIDAHAQAGFAYAAAGHPIKRMQDFLDDYVAQHQEAKLDYIHGEDALRALVSREDAVGFMPRAIDKTELFDYIRQNGALPRKSFSMGEAQDKRYYLEMRRLGR